MAGEAIMAKQRRRDLQPSDIEGLEYFDTLVPLLARLKDFGTQRDRAGNRQLFYDQYVCLLLLYTALIASLLVVLWTGRKPTKRTWEMLQFYFQGWASLNEVEAHLEKQKLIALKNQEKNSPSDKA
jgi:hypothetical protein